MNILLKRLTFGAFALSMMSVTVVSESPLRFELFRSAQAIIGVAPGGSVARRHAVVGAAAVTTTAVAATSASASAAAAANANAAAATANANAAAATANAAAAAAAAGPLPVGTVVAALPPDCSTTILNGVEYHRCGATYYQAAMQGNNLVYVVKQP